MAVFNSHPLITEHHLSEVRAFDSARERMHVGFQNMQCPEGLNLLALIGQLRTLSCPSCFS
jgi:hypothetical protein